MSAAPRMQHGLPLPLQSDFATLNLAHVLDDLCARFIVNLPADELEDMDRLCFQIEQAHWYYEDFVRPSAQPTNLPTFNLKSFSLKIFQSCPLLHDLVPDHPFIWTSFMAYKERVPVCGAILISEFWDKVLLVKGWQKGASWSFPRGKINKEEPEGMCAIREVLEETGYDLEDQFPAAQLFPGYEEREGATRTPYYVELIIKEQKIRLYFIPGVMENSYFETRTRKEISKIDWFNLDDLPMYGNQKKGKKVETMPEKNPKFYMVTPFMSHLKLWIQRNKPKGAARQRPPSPPPPAPYPHAHEFPPHLAASTQGLPFEELEQHVAAVQDDEVQEGTSRSTYFETAEEGSLALEAFFLGAAFDPPAAPLQPRPMEENTPTKEQRRPPPQSLSLSNLAPIGASMASPQLHDMALATPPHVAYERQAYFVQPRPNPSSNHTNRLLALLTDSNPTASPPPDKSSRQAEVKPISAPTSGRGSGNLLLALDRILPQSSMSSPNYRRPTSASSLSSEQSDDSDSDHYIPTRPALLTRTLSEKDEKHNALLQALQNVPSLAPPPPPVVLPAPKPNSNHLLSLLLPRHATPPPPAPPSVQVDDTWPPSPAFDSPAMSRHPSQGLELEALRIPIPGQDPLDDGTGRAPWTREASVESEAFVTTPYRQSFVDVPSTSTLPFPGEASPERPAPAPLPRTSLLNSNGFPELADRGPPLREREESHASSDAGPTKARQAAGMSLLSILNGGGPSGINGGSVPAAGATGDEMNWAAALQRPPLFASLSSSNVLPHNSQPAPFQHSPTYAPPPFPPMFQNGFSPDPRFQQQQLQQPMRHPMPPPPPPPFHNHPMPQFQPQQPFAYPPFPPQQTSPQFMPGLPPLHQSFGPPHPYFAPHPQFAPGPLGFPPFGGQPPPPMQPMPNFNSFPSSLPPPPPSHHQQQFAPSAQPPPPPPASNTFQPFSPLTVPRNVINTDDFPPLGGSKANAQKGVLLSLFNAGNTAVV